MSGLATRLRAALRPLRPLVLPIAAVALLLVLLDSAWVGEDALITSRTIINWVHGHGLRYNLDERVQSYTHPLWMLLNAAFYLFTREIYWTTTVVGLACSLGAWLVLAWRHRHRLWVVIGCLTLGWMASTCLRLYATSGLEDPLTFLLLAGFFAILLSVDEDRPPPWGWLSLMAALIATNRLDTGLFVAPALVWLVLSRRRGLRVSAIILGFSPLFLWLLFSLVYYGFPFPNTAPAKLETGFPLLVTVHGGALYLLDFVQNDLVSAMILLSALAVGAHAAWRWLAGRSVVHDRVLAVTSAGVLLYVLYVVVVGGGFLKGRFFAAPVLVSLAVLAERLPAVFQALRRARWPGRCGVVALVLVVVLGTYGAGLATQALTKDQRILALPIGRVSLTHDGRWVMSKWARIFRDRGRAAKRRAAVGHRVSAQHAMGFTGIAAGSDAILIDRFGLVDPLLARLPPEPGTPFRAGHSRRALPPGYAFARETGSLVRMDPDMAAYYARLRLVISGPIFSQERFATIADFMLGRIKPPVDDAESPRLVPAMMSSKRAMRLA
ncbi:MAG: hypothetical protein GXP62_18700 [Oligoflexia bacterium]|nr:hypothetical protein [Oligoflexia bacterium]